MTTFSIETCQRLAKVLGENPDSMFTWSKSRGKPYNAAPKGEWTLMLDGVEENEPNGTEVYPAFTIADLTGDVWQEIGKKLGWQEKMTAETLIQSKIVIPAEWEEHAYETWSAWLTGGYPAAEQYLNSILPE